MKFNELQIDNRLIKAAKKLGFEDTTQIQEKVIPVAITGCDVIAQAQTGTGKTCAFGFPVLHNVDENLAHVQALIMAPTRELALQITNDLKNYSQYMGDVRVTTVYGGENIEKQIRALKKKPQIVVATPGRLLDHLRRRTIKLKHLNTLVLDEADEMLNMGFREDIDNVLENVGDDHQTMLFSATFSNEIMKICEKYLKNPTHIKDKSKSLTVESVKQYYLLVNEKSKVEAISRLIDFNKYNNVMMFCNTKRNVDEVTSKLSQRGYMVEGLHGDMRQMQRDRVMARFRDGINNILVASDVAARGLDVDGIDAVINYDLPDDEEYYIHRIGRTGRAKNKGVSISLVTPKSKYRLRSLQRYTKAEIESIEVPSLKQVLNIRVDKIINESLENLKGKNKKTINEAIYKKLIQDNIPVEDVLTGIISQMIDNSEHIEKVSSERKSARGKDGRSRCFVSIGISSKISNKELISLISKNGKVALNAIKDLEMHDDYSFFEIDSSLLDGLLNNMIGTKYGSKRVSVEEAQSKGRSRNRKSRSVRERSKRSPRSRGKRESDARASNRRRGKKVSTRAFTSKGKKRH